MDFLMGIAVLAGVIFSLLFISALILLPFAVISIRATNKSMFAVQKNSNIRLCISTL